MKDDGDSHFDFTHDNKESKIKKQYFFFTVSRPQISKFKFMDGNFMSFNSNVSTFIFRL